MIDKPIIEALASLGGGIAPRFHWDANALSLKSAIDSLAVNRMSLPGTCDNYDALMAMAMGQHLTKVLTTRHELPEKQFRRMATIAMQFGASLVEIALTLKGHEQKVAALLNEAQTPDLLLNEKPILQTLLIAATCASKMPEGEAPEVISACQKLLLAAGGRQEMIALMSTVMDAVQTAETTKDFAEIAGSLFPDFGEQCKDAEESESEAMRKDAETQSSEKPSDGSTGLKEDGDSEGGNKGDPSSSESGKPDDVEQDKPTESGAASSSDAQAVISESASEAGAGKKPNTKAASVEDAVEEVAEQSVNDNYESDSQFQDAEGTVKKVEEVSSAQAEPDQDSCLKNMTDAVELEEDASAETSDTQGNAGEQTSTEDFLKPDGNQSAGEPESKEDGEPETDDAAQRVKSLPKGGTNGIKDTVSVNKLQFAKNQSLVSELVRILQSEDKRTTSIQDRGRKIVANKAWRLRKLGDARIFKQTSKVVGSQIAVELLIDASLSMGNHIKLACEVGLSFCDALQRLTKASSAMSLFAGRVGVSRVLKEHNEGFTKVAPKLTSVSAGGGTPTGLAMMQRLSVLVQQRQERKLMVVITDGAANDFRSVLQSVKYAEDNGIDVIGIGLGLEGRVIKTYIENSLNILSLNDLQHAIRELMKKRALA